MDPLIEGRSLFPAISAVGIRNLPPKEASSFVLISIVGTLVFRAIMVGWQTTHRRY